MPSRLARWSFVALVVSACSRKESADAPTASSATAVSAPPKSSSSAPVAGATSPPKSASTEGKKIAPSKGPATPPAKFTAKSKRKKGADVAYRFALAYRFEGSTALYVELSTHQRGCTDVGADERELGAGESIIDLVVAPQLGKGPTEQAVMRVAEQTSSGTQSFVTGRRADVKVVAGDPQKDVELVITNGKALVDDEPVLDGTIVAWGCRVVPDPHAASDPKAIPEPGLTLELGGKKLPIRGAIHRVQRNEIVLSTHGLSCTSMVGDTDVLLTLSDDGAKVQVAGLSITGEESPAPQKTPVKVTLQDFSFGRETDDVKLEGAFAIAGHQGKLQGSAKLKSCQ